MTDRAASHSTSPSRLRHWFAKGLRGATAATLAFGVFGVAVPEAESNPNYGHPCGSCGAGKECRRSWARNKMFCAASGRQCSVPMSGHHGVNLGYYTHVKPPFTRSDANSYFDNAFYVCIQDSNSPGAPVLRKERYHTERCGWDAVCSSYKRGTFSGQRPKPNDNMYCSQPKYTSWRFSGARSWSEKKRCLRQNASKCVTDAGGKVNVGTARTQGGRTYLCRSGGNWVEEVPNGKKTNTSEICDSRRATGWVSGSQQYCVATNKHCAMPNSAGKNQGEHVTVGGKKRVCMPYPHGWRLGDGEACSTNNQCGVMSTCRNGPGNSGKFCKGFAKKCAWPKPQSGLNTNQVRTYQGRRYKCRSNGTYQDLGPA